MRAIYLRRIVVGLTVLLMGIAAQASPASHAPPAAPTPFILKAVSPVVPVASNLPPRVTAPDNTSRLPEGRSELLDAQEDLQAGRRDLAIAKLEAIIKKNPGQHHAWEALFWAYWQAGRQDDAIRLMEKLRDLDPSLPTPYNMLGQAYAGRNDLTKAAENYAKSLSLNPEQYEVSFGLARIYRWSGDMDRAIEIFRVLLAKDPQRMDVKLELARALLDNRDYNEAAPIWAEAMRLSPTNQEYMVRQAIVLLHTGHVKESQALAAKILERDPTNVQIYLMQADTAELSEHPEDAADPLRKVVQLARDDQQRRQARTRLIRLLVRLNQKSPLKYSVDEPVRLVRDMLRDDPNNVDANLMLGELLLMELKLNDAERQFLHVLKNYNTNNQRAHRGLFETYVAMRRYDEAKKQYKLIEAFNPQDPYLFSRQARLEECRGNYRGVDKALQKLETVANQGAVAVLIYHGLTTSEWLDITSVRQFQQHLAALKKAGFRFITPDEIPAYFARVQKASAESRGAVPERVVCVTFDDARRDAMRLGTEIARQMHVKIAMHVPVGNVERGDPFICSWEQLKQYQDTGVWVLGSHLMYASDILPVTSDKQLGYPLANRLWLEKEGRLETDEEFAERMKVEYHHSRELLEQHLGRKVEFMAYPMGDIGQETAGNVQSAISINLAEASTNYLVGFIQSPYGFAVNGDNPLLYQRYEVERGVTAEDLVNRILENHPYYLGLAMRAQMAALEGKVHLAQELVDELKQSGYPEPLQAKVDEYVHNHLAGKYEAATKTETVKKGPFHLSLAHPYVGVQGEYFRDNLDVRNWRVYGLGGMNLTPNLAVEGRGGFGQMKQPMTNSLPPYPTPPPIPDIKLTEKMVGVAPSFTFPNGWVLMGELSARNFTGDVPTNLNGKTVAFDKTFLQYAVEGQAKPLLPLDVALRWEHDVMPTAREVANSTTYNMASVNAVYSLFDWWNLWGGGQHYAISDGNKRDHLSLLSDWTVSDLVGVGDYLPGLHAGLGYAYANASDSNPDYWTPYRLNRYFAELGLRGNYRRSYYNLRLRYGVGKQSVRPEAEQHYQDLLKQAQAQHWPQSAIDQLIATKPEEKWQPVLGASASSTIKLGEHWEAEGEVSYNKVPDYNELSVTGGVKYKF